MHWCEREKKIHRLRMQYEKTDYYYMQLVFDRRLFYHFDHVVKRKKEGTCATMRERPESVESPGTYVTK